MKLADIPAAEALSHLTTRRHLRGYSRRFLLSLTLFTLLAIQPALAQQSAVCSAQKLPGMIEGFFQLTTGLGLMGLVVVWQANALMELVTLSRDQKEAIKRHKRDALKSAVILVVLGPLYTVAGTMMNLPLADCVNLVPW